MEDGSQTLARGQSVMLRRKHEQVIPLFLLEFLPVVLEFLLAEFLPYLELN